MLKNILMSRFVVFCCLLCVILPLSNSQTDGRDLLKKEYPLLMEKFGDELNKQRADYIFAIDVSGTMAKYSATLSKALKEFFGSMQQGDYVSIIKFGADAVQEVGSSDVISDATLPILCRYIDNVYAKSKSKEYNARFFNNTDLDNMLHKLADDMIQPGRNNLKFVFLITDFIHDPLGVRSGKEDWDGVRKRFEKEQIDNNVYLFALQLPGTARDLDRVHKSLPQSFKFSHVAVNDGNALASWFRQRKNAILLEKFQALIAGKIEDAGLGVGSEVDIDGNLTLNVNWKPNDVYDMLRIDTLLFDNDVYRFKSSLPVVIDDPQKVDAGKFKSMSQPIWPFQKIEGNITVKASFDVPYLDELTRLSFDTPSLETESSISRIMFCFPLPFWFALALLILFIIYIVLVIIAARRNHKSFNFINGKFEVTRGGMPVTEKKPAVAKKRVDIGKGAGFLAVPDSNWTLEIYVETYFPMSLKKPVYRVKMTKGSSFKVKGSKWGMHQTPEVPRYSNINIEDYRIRWIQ